MTGQGSGAAEPSRLSRGQGFREPQPSCRRQPARQAHRRHVAAPREPASPSGPAVCRARQPPWSWHQPGARARSVSSEPPVVMDSSGTEVTSSQPAGGQGRARRVARCQKPRRSESVAGAPRASRAPPESEPPASPGPGGVDRRGWRRLPQQQSRPLGPPDAGQGSASKASAARPRTLLPETRRAPPERRPRTQSCRRRRARAPNAVRLGRNISKRGF